MPQGSLLSLSLSLSLVLSLSLCLSLSVSLSLLSFSRHSLVGGGCTHASRVLVSLMAYRQALVQLV